MANTTNWSITYPTTANNITPLATHFANIANSTDTALTNARNASGRYTGTDAQRLALVAGTGRTEGTNYFTTDSDREWQWDGANWISNDGGLFLIRPTSVTGATISADGAILPTAAAVGVNGVFNSRFRKYRVDYYCRYEVATNPSVTLRAAGANNVTTNYNWGTMEGINTSIIYTSFASQASWPTTNGNAQNHWGHLEFTNPAMSGTNMLKVYSSLSHGAIGAPTTLTHRQGYMLANDATVFDGFGWTATQVPHSASYLKVYGLA